ncbi:hypothetical protein TMP248_110076 [Tenacibaculum maritimum]|uniref:hypothetical protein n=1 Tax=Tenacibaculum maritimum TaxID=107401 RepID=UPI0012E51815|nr:hypothetical protein [Tenacibaculum maritimum]CAA0162901.1 hypothetical protein TMP248_110076 [Tenacibaculum maritimum]CAA0173633.1 hypothetical protein FS0810_140043 [Tenacibaculum maritimum]
MNSEEKFPLAFFDWYLDSQIYFELQNFYHESTNHIPDIIEINKKEQTIKALNSYGKLDTYKFETTINSKLHSEAKKTIRLIESGFEQRFSNRNEVNAYAGFLKIKINNLLNHKTNNDFIFLKQYFQQILQEINKFIISPSINSFNPSFNFKATTKEEAEEKLTILYNGLTDSPSLINCKKIDFIKAFSSQEVENKIQWIAKSKRNKKTARTTLLYLLDKLIENKYLNYLESSELYQSIKYVFVDDKYSPLENLKNTRYNMSDNPDYKNRIDNIISSL